MMEFNELYLQGALGTVAFYRSLLTAQPTRLDFRGKCKVEAPSKSRVTYRFRAERLVDDKSPLSKLSMTIKK